MPILDGIEATRLLAGPDAPDPIAVVVITTFDTDEHVYDALIDPAVTGRLLAAFAAGGPATRPSRPVHPLTGREEDVLVRVARGRTNAEIARDLHISLSTVKFHLAGLTTKLGARNRVELALWAYQTNRLT
ncbi:DNA-binding response regulator, NarL/FixJ family, contains REC and HTH domains [Paractinoplanes atraurantiacus]|uniref:DNA-binding response regulator, NarL/FixJ family, contains REC and HTH domains n=1 Tax=Paractinoplanes atraurantiacus TaxID=1036182 RepID=A0A285HVH2_9ACTN|nr:DNA-binding response regulator, NarL/FixJ family, contains REC and HTH domains [Actinoplanes atraurantiacus]